MLGRLAHCRAPELRRAAQLGAVSSHSMEVFAIKFLNRAIPRCSESQSALNAYCVARLRQFLVLIIEGSGFERLKHAVPHCSMRSADRPILSMARLHAMPHS